MILFSATGIGGVSHILIRQPRVNSPSRSNWTAGFLLFEENKELKIALLPPEGNDNRGMVDYLSGQEGISIEPVDFRRLPASEVKRINDNRSDKRDTPLLIDAFVETRDWDAAQKSAQHILHSEFNLIGVKADGDDNTLSKTIQILNELGLIADLSTLNEAIAKMQSKKKQIS